MEPTKSSGTIHENTPCGQLLKLAFQQRVTVRNFTTPSGVSKGLINSHTEPTITSSIIPKGYGSEVPQQLNATQSHTFLARAHIPSAPQMITEMRGADLIVFRIN